MKKLLILLLFSNFINAQIDPTDYPRFDSCKNVKGDEIRNCFLDHLYEQLYLRLKGKVSTTGKTLSIQIFFGVDDQGEFRHLTNSATPETLSNTIAAAFKDLPRVKPVRFLGEPASEKFGIILKIPLQRNGSLSEIITSAVPPPPPAPEIIAVVEDDVEIEEVIIEDLGTPLNLQVHEPVEEGVEMKAIPYPLVENVPIYSGCESWLTNADRKKCTSEKINRFVNREYNTTIAEELGFTGRQMVVVQFSIDIEGKSGKIKAKAEHPRLEEEAARVIQKLPQMQPGMEDGKPVEVIYALPIIFQVQD